MSSMVYYTLIIEMFILVWCAVNAGKKKETLNRIICAHECAAAVAAAAYVVYLTAPTDVATLFFYGIVWAARDWYVYFLIQYVEKYTEMFKGKIAFKKAVVCYFVFDSIMLLANPWTNAMFTITDMENMGINFALATGNILCILHYSVFYLLMAFVILTFGYAIVHASKFYRFRYVTLFIITIVANLLNLLVILWESMYGISLVTYGIMSIFIYYFTFKYIPDELIENILSRVVRDLKSGIVCFDSAGRCVYINELVKEIYFDRSRIEEGEEIYSSWLKQTGAERKDSMTFDKVWKHGGQTRYYEVKYQRVYDERDSFICDYFMYNDCTEQVESYERQKYLATHDELTGLLNKKQFLVEVSRLLHENPGRQYSMIYSNIKDFKIVNEVFGMAKGDEVLKKRAELMRQYMKDGALLARLRGDRFAVCMPSDEVNEEWIHAEIREVQQDFRDNLFHLHICTGIYEIMDIEEDVSIMCDKAASAGDAIKDDSQEIAYYDKKLLEKSVEEKKILSEFEDALRKKQLAIFLQPQVDAEGRLYGAEALVRWYHPKRGLLFPGAFVPVLEKEGLIYKMDRCVWELAAEQLKKWKELGITTPYISVNVSARDFYYIDIYKTFVELVAKYDISPDRLNIEITETAIMEDTQKNMDVIRQLQEFGFRIEIDDFGSGYSSLNMLKDINADVLKIDMAFLQATENEKKARDILQAVIALSEKLGLDVITEGVETIDQVTMLKAMGENMFQGYYFSKPIPVNEFEQKYELIP